MQLSVVFGNVAIAYLLPIHITTLLRSIVAISKSNENDRFQSIHVMWLLLLLLLLFFFFLGNKNIFEEKDKLHSAFIFSKAYLHATEEQFPFLMPHQTIFDFCGH